MRDRDLLLVIVFIGAGHYYCDGGTAACLCIRCAVMFFNSSVSSLGAMAIFIAILFAKFVFSVHSSRIVLVTKIFAFGGRGVSL